MNILIFNGAPDQFSVSTSRRIVEYLTVKLHEKGFNVEEFHLADADIPFLSLDLEETPPNVATMCEAFIKADAHIWLSPLYHGGIPGSMKNCLDWLELTSELPKPYLSDKVIGLICWANGIQAMQGINNMDAIAKALRAWVLPYSIPITKRDLYQEDEMTLNVVYLARFDIMVNIIDDAVNRLLE